MDSAVDQQHQGAYHRRQYGVDSNEDGYDVGNRDADQVDPAKNYMFDLDSAYHHRTGLMTLKIVGWKETIGN